MTILKIHKPNLTKIFLFRISKPYLVPRNWWTLNVMQLTFHLSIKLKILSMIIQKKKKNMRNSDRQDLQGSFRVGSYNSITHKLMDLACGHFSTLLKKNKIKWSIIFSFSKHIYFNFFLILLSIITWFWFQHGISVNPGKKLVTLSWNYSKSINKTNDKKKK